MNEQSPIEIVKDSQVEIIKKFKSESMWFLITIDFNPIFLPSEVIFNIIQLILTVINFKFIILNDMIGNGGISALQEKEDDIIEVAEFLKLVLDVQDFEWGDFFLFKEEPSHWDHPQYPGYPFLICQADTTVRAIDNQYLYIYTQYEEILNLIKENYVIESIKIGDLEYLDYPT